jgi:hypothetical protein
MRTLRDAKKHEVAGRTWHSGARRTRTLAVPIPMTLRRLSSSPVPPLAAATLLGSLALFAYGIVLRWRDPAGFLVWIREDGLVEWLTFVALAVAASCAICRALDLRRIVGGARGARLWFALAAALFFGALEEISYGQRILGWETPEWLKRWNAQDETNFHNLEFGDFSVNKVIFGKALALFLILYVLVLPLLARRPPVSAFVDRWRIPLVQAYQVIAWLVVLLGVRLALRKLPGDPERMTKVQEYQEFMGSVLFLLAIRHPSNASILLQGAAPSPPRPGEGSEPNGPPGSRAP